MEKTQLPIAVIGAGPVGLAAAAHLVSKGELPLILEAGAHAGASVLQWGHVRLFSPWRYNVDALAASLLQNHGWEPPPPGEHPTGRDLVERYLAPLAALPSIRPHLRLNTRVLGVSRRGLDRTKSASRERSPFVVRVEAEGTEDDLLARAVIDASGTWGSPNPLGAGGLPAIGEGAARDRIFYGIPDVLGADRARYAGRRVLVVGSGHSAFGVLLDLAALRTEAPGTEIAWAVRRPNLDRLFGGGASDQLEERGRLGARTRALVADGTLRIVTDFRLSRIVLEDQRLVASSEERQLAPVDEIVAATGFRPDLTILRELRLDLDAVVESPAALAPLIDPNLHSCGSVPPHGFDELRQPDPDFFVVGMKSYGRAPTFLMLTGYEQVRSVVCALTGDLEGARRVELRLPETGVCSSDPVSEVAEVCCGPDPSATATSRCGADGCATPVALRVGDATRRVGCC